MSEFFISGSSNNTNIIVESEKSNIGNIKNNNENIQDISYLTFPLEYCGLFRGYPFNPLTQQDLPQNIIITDYSLQLSNSLHTIETNEKEPSKYYPAHSHKKFYFDNNKYILPFEYGESPLFESIQINKYEANYYFEFKDKDNILVTYQYLRLTPIPDESKILLLNSLSSLTDAINYDSENNILTQEYIYKRIA